MIARIIWVALKLYSENNYHIVTNTLQSLSLRLEAYIEPGEPSDQCPRGFIYEPSSPYCKGVYLDSGPCLVVLKKNLECSGICREKTAGCHISVLSLPLLK